MVISTPNMAQAQPRDQESQAPLTERARRPCSWNSNLRKVSMWKKTSGTKIGIEVLLIVIITTLAATEAAYLSDCREIVK